MAKKKRASTKTAGKKGRSSSPGESPASRRERTKRIIAELRKLYPDADCALVHTSALELLVATILSAQSTDVNVNKVTPVLFAEYPTVRDLAAARPEDVEKIIHSTGFFRQKTKSIINASKVIVEAHGGEVPDTMEGLVQLPGVARKTANVILGTWFGKNEGVVVDTHIGRLAHRLGLTWMSKDDKDAVKIERDLMQVIPREDWTYAGHAMIWHGRRVCSARKPDCERCTLNTHCPTAFTWDGSDKALRTTMKAAGRKPADKAKRKKVGR